MESYRKYYELRNKIDELTDRLEDLHQNHMACKMGCDLCCMDYSILPIEFYCISSALKDKNVQIEVSNINESSSCIFLKNHKCSIYSERPVICRTHGLPLLYMNDDGDWELSACELNFTLFSMDGFTIENTFPQDKFNSELFMLNKTFISELKGSNYNEFDLIPIRKLTNTTKINKT